MRRTALALALPLPFAATMLVGCGDDGYPDKPEQVAKAYVATNAGSKCRFLTQRLIESLTGRQGVDARRTCERNVAQVPRPKKVTLRDSEVDAHDAEVEVLSDGSEAKLKMVRSGDRWKIAGFSD